jgi:hypothetical protein
MKTWLVIVSVIAVLLAASAGVAFWMLSNMKTELTSMQDELTDIKAELAEIKGDYVPPIPTNTYTLSVSVSPSGAGAVSPSGGEYDPNTQVTLTASPASGYTFAHWSGSASDTASTIYIIMDSDKSLTANFERAPSEISWDEAKNHVGEWATESNPVYGPVVGASYRPDISGQPTWLNIGEDYPNQNRFVVIIWGENRGNFPQAPEDYYLGKTIYVTGLIDSYEGVPQIEVTSPDQIHE